MENEIKREKFPTCQCEEHYQAGNDYCQTKDMFVTSSYADGIFTEAVSGWEGACQFNVNNILVDATAPYSAAEYSVVSAVSGEIDGVDVDQWKCGCAK